MAYCVDRADRLDRGRHPEATAYGPIGPVTPNERRDVPWIVAIGIATCLAVLVLVAYYAL
jgi:hypothetical protein